ncbi:MAG TPA: homocysteine S-methyltransferase family protein [Gaiellaceae bacterium]|nr:homocysteine S-methyltransferase family protein [Gaiellaceae bacterium]
MLPQLGDDLYLTDGGMETWLIYDAGLELPQFASFPLLDSVEGLAALRAYYAPYVELARENDVGLVLDAPTWRASRHWGELLGYGPAQLADVNRRGVAFVDELRRESDGVDIVVGGCVGPSDDAYTPSEQLSVDAAYAYHQPQIESFADTPADFVNALTLTYSAEALGIARAANDAGLPVALSFTVETDGRLPGGERLADAIATVDAGADVAYYMVNCAHPTHFADILDGPWCERVVGVRANASAKSHAQLDEAEELDAGDPLELAGHYPRLRDRLPNLRVAGGCCGTDERHIAAIYTALRD